MDLQDRSCSPTPPAVVSPAQHGGRHAGQPAALDAQQHQHSVSGLDGPVGEGLAAPAESDTEPAKAPSGADLTSAPASGLLSRRLGGDAEPAHYAGSDIVLELTTEHVLPAAEAAADAPAHARAKSSATASGVLCVSPGANAQPDPGQSVRRRARAESSIGCKPAGQPQAERPDSVPDAAATGRVSCPRAQNEPSAAVVPGVTFDAGALESDRGSDAEAGMVVAEVPRASPKAKAAEPEQRCSAAADVPVAEMTDRAPQPARGVVPNAHAMPGQRRPVKITAEELSDMRRRLEQQPSAQRVTAHLRPAPHTVTAVPDGSARSPCHAQPARPALPKTAQHAEAAAREPALQPETPLPSRLTPASPSDTTDLSQDEPTAQTPPCSKLEVLSACEPPTVDVGPDTGAAEKRLSACVSPPQSEPPSQADPAQRQATTSGFQRVDAAPQAAAAPAARPVTPDEPARCDAATPLPPAPRQQAGVRADAGMVAPVPAPAVDHGAAAMPPQPLAAQTAAQPAPHVSPAQGDGQDPLYSLVTAAGDAALAQPTQQEVGQHGHAYAPAAAAASQQVIPPRTVPEQPGAADGIAVDDVDIEASDMEAEPTDEDGAAAALLAHMALQKEARLLLAQQAGCSRAVPQHAVALMASLWGSATAVRSSRVAAINSLAGTTQRRRVTAACWQDAAEWHGCARAVSRADITRLVGLISPAELGAETPKQVSLCSGRA